MPPQVAPAEPEGPELPGPDELEGGTLPDKLRTLFDGLGLDESVRGALEREIVGAAERSLELAREQALSGREEAHRAEIDDLERKIDGLRQVLDSTEEELHRLLDQKTLDPGVASVYRQVEGLSPNAKSYEQKKEVLGLIYEANVRLLNELKGNS